MKKNLFIRIICTIVFVLILYYFMLPPINLHAFSFYMYLILVLSFYLIISIPSLFSNLITTKFGHTKIKFKTFLRKGFAPKRGRFGIYCYCGKQGSGKLIPWLSF